MQEAFPGTLTSPGTPTEAGLPKGRGACQELGHCWVLGSCQVRTCQEEPRKISLWNQTEWTLAPVTGPVSASFSSFVAISSLGAILSPTLGVVNEILKMRGQADAQNTPLPFLPLPVPVVPCPAGSTSASAPLFSFHALGTHHLLVFSEPQVRQMQKKYGIFLLLWEAMVTPEAPG